MKPARVAVIGLMLLATIAVTVGAAQTKAPVPTQKGSGGTYRITVHGKAVGAEHFEMVTSGDETTLTTESRLTVGDSEEIVNSSLELEKGSPVHYTVESGSSMVPRKYTLTFDAGVIKAKVESTGKTAERTVKVPSGIVVLDKDVWSQYRVLFGKYDMNKKGLQSFQAFTPVPALRAYGVDVELDKPTSFRSGAEILTRKSPTNMESQEFIVNRFFVRLADGLGLTAMVSADGTPVEIELPTQDVKITLM